MKKSQTYGIQVYRAADGWRWRMRAANGRKIADSGEAYTRKRAAIQAARCIADGAIFVFWPT